MTWHSLLRDRTADDLLSRVGWGGDADRLRVRDDSSLFAQQLQHEPTIHFAFASGSGICFEVARVVWGGLLASLPQPPVFLERPEEYWAETVGGLVGREDALCYGSFQTWARDIVKSAYKHARPQDDIEMDDPVKREFVERLRARYRERTGFPEKWFGDKRLLALFGKKKYVEVEEALREYLKADLEKRAGGGA